MPWLPTAIWLGLLILFAVAEAATVGLVSIWFAAGALCALLASYFTENVWAQVAVFLAVSALAMLVLRPLARRFVLPKIVPTNTDRLIGREAVVTEDIDNLRSAGTAVVSGVAWTARSLSGEVIPAGTTVTVERIEGVKLMVSPAQPGKE